MSSRKLLKVNGTPEYNPTAWGLKALEFYKRDLNDPNEMERPILVRPTIIIITIILKLTLGIRTKKHATVKMNTVFVMKSKLLGSKVLKSIRISGLSR